MTDGIKRSAYELYEFLLADIVNYLALFMTVVLIASLAFPANVAHVFTIPAAKVVAFWWTAIVCGSILWLVVSEFVYCLRLFAYVGSVSGRLNEVIAAIDAAPTSYRALELARKAATDVDEIAYFNKVSVMSSYEAMGFIAHNFGYLLILVLAALGANPVASLGITAPWMLMLPIWCAISVGVRYFSAYLLALAASSVAEDYSKVIQFHAKNATSELGRTN